MPPIKYADCVSLDVKTFDWIYFYAGISWFLMGYYLMKCGDSLRKVREREELQERLREEVITAQAVNSVGESQTS
tara:strand:+ start:665 stop:889 length:225 start_codon:yes stop_codon:yes gene_type:complete